MANSPQFTKVTSVLFSMAEKMARLEGDPEVRKAAEFWKGELQASLEPRAVNFARGRKTDPKKS